MNNFCLYAFLSALQFSETFKLVVVREASCCDLIITCKGNNIEVRGNRSD